MGVKARVVIVLVLLVAGYMTFGSRTDHISLFVAVEQWRSETLVEQIAGMLEKKGLKSWISRATDDHGKTRVVLESVGGNSSITLTNVPLSGQYESGPCEPHVEAYPDPQQFEVRFRSRFRIVQNRKKLADLKSEMEDFLRMQGIPFRKSPWLCGAAAFSGTSEGGSPGPDTVGRSKP
jgi:hypothetical protein